MTIPSVVQGMIKTEDGKVFELDSSKGAAWLETVGSFRYQPTGDGKPYTVRKEASSYWYGCRKVTGKVRKKYIGKSSEVNLAKLEEIAEALEIPAEPRVKQVTEVTEVAQEVAEVAQEVAGVAQTRLTVLEARFTALEKTVEDLREALLGKSGSGDSLELPKVDNEVVEQLHNELGNLKVKNEGLQSEYSKLLASSHIVTEKLREEVRELRSQLAAEKARSEGAWEEMEDSEKALAAARSELADLKQKSAPAGKDLPDAADLLNRLKAKRKKSGASLADVEALLEMIDEG